MLLPWSVRPPLPRYQPPSTDDHGYRRNARERASAPLEYRRPVERRDRDQLSRSAVVVGRGHRHSAGYSAHQRSVLTAAGRISPRLCRDVRRRRGAGGSAGHARGVCRHHDRMVAGVGEPWAGHWLSLVAPEPLSARRRRGWRLSSSDESRCRMVSGARAIARDGHHQRRYRRGRCRRTTGHCRDPWCRLVALGVLRDRHARPDLDGMVGQGLPAGGGASRAFSRGARGHCGSPRAGSNGGDAGARGRVCSATPRCGDWSSRSS